MNKNFIETDNISYKTRNIKILTDISLRINPGEIHCIIGASSSGKSTLLKVLANKLKPTKGKINGKISCRKDEIGEKKTFYTTSFPLNFEINHEDSVSNFLTLSKISLKKLFSPINDSDKQDIEYYLQHFNLKKVKNLKLKEISSSNLSKAKLSYAFLQNSPLLLLDNPLVNLDLKSISSVYKTIKKYVINGDRSVVIATHNLNFASQIADKVYIIDNGKIVESGNGSIINRINILRYFESEALVSKNIYNGKSELHFFSLE